MGKRGSNVFCILVVFLAVFLQRLELSGRTRILLSAVATIGGIILLRRFRYIFYRLWDFLAYGDDDSTDGAAQAAHDAALADPPLIDLLGDGATAWPDSSIFGVPTPPAIWQQQPTQQQQPPTQHQQQTLEQQQQQIAV